MRRSIMVLAVCMAHAIPLLAQDTTRAQPLKEITVTAERFPHALLTTPAVVRFISPSQLSAKAAPDLLTLLRELPGVQVDPVVGSGLGISLQGLGADRILVLMDGAPVEGRLANQFDLTRLDPKLFERIEIVEGPQSTLYGSSALGGVINLVSRAPGGRRAEFSTQGGSFGQFDLSGHLGAVAGSTSYGLDGSRRHIDVAPGQGDNVVGGADRWDVMGRMVRPLGTGTLNLRAMYGHEEQTYLSGDGAPPANNSNRNNQLDLLGVADLGATGATQLRAHASTYDHVLDRTTISSGATTSEPQQQRVADLELIHRATVGRTDLVLGARGEHEWITSSRLIEGEQSNTNGAAYATAQYRLSAPLALSAGARVTAAQHWGTDVAPRVGLVWHNGVAYAKTGVAHGFRAPAFTEQFSDFPDPSGYFILHGNPDLKPESSWNITAEVGVQGRLASAYIRGYGNRLRNFIEPTMIGMQGQLPIFSYTNVGKARTVGGEIGGAVHHGIATLEASYAYLDAKDQDTDAPLLGRASHSVRAGLSLAQHRWSLASEFVRTSRLPLSQNPGSGQILYEGAAPRVNLRAGLAINHAWQLRAGVDNLNNTIPENALAGFHRRWFGGLTWNTGW